MFCKKAVLQNLEQQNSCDWNVEKILVEKWDKMLVDNNCETYTVDHIQLTALLSTNDANQEQ